WCLFSSHAPGEGAGRGRCAERCRAAFRPDDDAGAGRGDTCFPFSMKDLALADHLDDLISAGVDALGIDSRGRSPLYVAAVTDFYRRLLDGELPEGDRARAEADIRTIFSRPWTDYLIDGRTNREVALGAAAAHRGTPIGEVESVTMRPARPRAFLRFRTSRRLEVHDGLRVEIPGEDRPFGFAIETMHLVTKSRRKGSREVFEAPAGSTVEVGLPEECPLMPPGAVVRCSSSQEVKQRYGFARPKPGRFRGRRPVDVLVEVAPDGLRAAARVADARIEARVEVAGELDTAKDASNTERAARTAFEKLGDTRFRLGSFELRNPDGMFVPASVLNRLRRDVTASLDAKLAAATASHLEALKAKLAARPAPADAGTGEFRWSVKTDRLANLAAFEPDDWRGIHEVIVDIARDGPADLHSGLESIAVRLSSPKSEAAGRDRARLALPAITRAWERDDLLGKIAALAGSGWTKWQIAGASGWEHLRAAESIDVTTDWPLYVANRQAGRLLIETGASGFTLLPGEAVADCAELLEEFGAAATVVVYGDRPVFVSEACVHANLAGGCPGSEGCSFESVPMLSSFGDRIVALREGCRTVVIHRDPFCLSDSLDDLSRAGARSLRVDLVWRSYTPEQARDIWRTVRRGDRPERATLPPPARGS
ncbi:MAG: peptidase U32 family protein, partial [Planctomycetota bacterium]